MYEVVYEPPPTGPAPQRAVIAKTAGFVDAVQSVLLHMPSIGIAHLQSPSFIETQAGQWVGTVEGAGEYRIVRITIPDAK
jgi:hypothetical protein